MAILQDYSIKFITHYYSNEPLFSDKWASIITNYQINNTIGMLHSRSRACTLNLKIMPIFKFIACFINHYFGFTRPKKKNFIDFANYHKKIKMLIFFSAEEQHRVHHCSPSCKVCPKYKRLSIDTLYPLIDYNLTRSDIQNDIVSLGHPLFIPSACDICHFMTELQLEFFRRFDPNPIAILIRLEQNKFRKFRHLPFLVKNKGVFGNMTVLQKVQKAYDRYKHLTDEEVREKILSFSHCIRNSY